MKPFLTIGMAHVEDFNGVFMTIQSIRQNNDCSEVEFIVINNGPRSQHAQEVKHFLIEKINNKGNAGCRYIDAPDPRGTSAPRNRVFQEAAGDFVMVVDSHVILPGARRRPDGSYLPAPVDRLQQFYRDDPTNSDLCSGPIVLDNDTVHTHFDDFWRGEMWGIWGWAWRCGCGHEGIQFTPHQPLPGMPVKAYALAMGMVPVTFCSNCSKPLPADLSHSNLETQGYVRMGVDDTDPHYEIPGNGLGLFTCRKEAWLGFNEHARGFGGEELYIHEKFRAAGRKCWCLPWLKWNHRFAKVGTGQFPANRYSKYRNYVLEFNEMGWPLDPVYEHAVADAKRTAQQTGLLSQVEWEHLIADPIKHTESPIDRKTIDTAGGLPAPTIEDVQSIDALFNWMKRTPRDIEKHADKLREVASQCEHVTELTTRREGSIALLAGGPKRMLSYSTEQNAPVYEALQRLAGDRLVVEFTPAGKSPAEAVDKPEETDLLFIDSIHTAKALELELAKFAPKVRRYIVLHDTKVHADKGEDGKEGLFHALRPWLEAHPDWFPAYHTDNQFGLTVLSKDLADWPEQPVNPGLLGYGPGSELKAMLRDFGIEPPPGCDCNGKAKQMDLWGVAGCRTNRRTIIGWMQDGQEKWKDISGKSTWGTTLRAGLKALTVSPLLALKLDMTNPWPQLIDEAIVRAEKKLEKVHFAKAKAAKREKAA